MWTGGFIPQLFRILMLLMSPTKLWKEALKICYMAGKSKKREYIRFDIEFKEKELILDDTSKMRELSAYARAAIYKSTELDRLVRCMISELSSLN
jgi:hypothetical protein